MRADKYLADTASKSGHYLIMGVGKTQRGLRPQPSYFRKKNSWQNNYSFRDGSSHLSVPNFSVFIFVQPFEF
jgi:hypothetical protein